MASRFVIEEFRKFSPQLCRRRRRARKSAALCISNKSNRGQATLEYVLLLSILGLIALAFVTFFSETMGTGITRFNAVLEKELATGSFREKTTTWRVAQ